MRKGLRRRSTRCPRRSATTPGRGTRWPFTRRSRGPASPRLCLICRKGRPRSRPAKAGSGSKPLAARLRVLGDLPRDVTVDGATYNPALVTAVKQFQQRHGLDADGVIGAGTIRAVNVKLAQRVRQIELAMERMRWLPALSDQPNVFVNLPLFRLWATDPGTGAEPLRMNVVVGKSLNHQTPIFVEQMEYVIFRPYWNPPPSITVNEIVPKARRDPSYLAQRRYGDCRQRRRQRDRAAGHAGESVAGGRRPAAPAPETRAAQLARPGQIHLPERRERLHARHASAAAVLARAPRLQPRLHPARESGAVRRVGFTRSAGVDARAY